MGLWQTWGSLLGISEKIESVSVCCYGNLSMTCTGSRGPEGTAVLRRAQAILYSALMHWKMQDPTDVHHYSYAEWEAKFS